MTRDFAACYGPWALVTGASSGIGEAFTRALAARGLHLVLTARRAERLNQLAAELRERHGIETAVVPVDLAQPAVLPPLLDGCAGKDIGLVVSNAGFGLQGAHDAMDAERLTAMLNVNCQAPTLLARAFAPRLVARGRGMKVALDRSAKRSEARK